MLVIDEILLAARPVFQRRLVRVDADFLVERGQHYAEVDGAFDNLLAEAVGLADYLARFQASAAQEAAADLGPVIAASVFFDDWRAAEIAQATKRPTESESATLLAIHCAESTPGGGEFTAFAGYARGRASTRR